MDDNGPAIADVTEPAAEWSNSGAERSERPLAPSVLYARALASIVSIRTDTGSGSGFAVSAKGVIATNVHVLAGARKIEVFLMNGTKLQLKPAIAIDEEHDLAALQVTQQLPPLALARDDRIVLGQKVVVIGNPLGLEATLSEGLVSGVRKLNKDSRALQITAPISPGSSGGPILNDHGEVIGISTFVLVGGANLNFGMPVGYLKELMRSPKFMSRAEVARLQPPHRSADAAPPDAGPPPSEPPPAGRDIPNHDVALLKGCGTGDYRQIRDLTGEAIRVGSPLYSAKNFRTRAQIYEGASSDLERSLSDSCSGPRKALADGRRRAAKELDDARRGWVLRDSFDGLTRVIDKLESARESAPPK